MRGKIVQLLEGHQTAHVWPACATRGQRGPLAVWHTWSTRGNPLLGLWPSNLSRTSRVLQPYSGIRTPNSNPFSDYEP